MEMSAAIGNPDINRAMGQDIRGRHHVMTDNQQLIERSGSIQQKSKTANITDLIQ